MASGRESAAAPEAVTTSTPAGAQLSPRRRLVVAAIFVLALITYIDRAAISSAKGPIAVDLSLGPGHGMGAAFSTFALGYALAQIPAGRFVRSGWTSRSRHASAGTSG